MEEQRAALNVFKKTGTGIDHTRSRRCDDRLFCRTRFNRQYSRWLIYQSIIYANHMWTHKARNMYESHQFTTVSETVLARLLPVFLETLSAALFSSASSSLSIASTSVYGDAARSRARVPRSDVCLLINDLLINQKRTATTIIALSRVIGVKLLVERRQVECHLKTANYAIFDYRVFD